MSSAAVEILIVFVLIVVNGVFAMSEAAIISARKTRLQQRAETGDTGARAALDLARTPGNFLATVQIGITLIGILAGAFSGATLSEQFADAIKTTVPALADYADTIALLVVVVAITLFSLIIGELVPKNLALNNPEGIASAIAIPMHFLSRLMFPLVALLNWITTLILRLLNVTASDEPAVTEEEIKQMVKQGAQAGTFEKGESRIVEQVFRLDDLRVSSLMTPRTEVIWLNLEDTEDRNQRKIIEHRRACYPLIRGTPDNILGIVWAKDLLASSYRREPLNLEALAVEPLFIPGGTTALRLLDILKQADSHIALVIDEYGGLQGLVTMTDVLNEIVSDTLSTTSGTDSHIVRREDGSLLVDGLLLIDKLKEVLHLAELPNEEDYETLGGLMMSQFGHIPVAADHFELQAWRFEVVDMDGHRVDKVLIQTLVPAGKNDIPAQKT